MFCVGSCYLSKRLRDGVDDVRTDTVMLVIAAVQRRPLGYRAETPTLRAAVAEPPMCDLHCYAGLTQCSMLFALKP